MKTISDDPESFFEGGGWSFLDPDDSVRMAIVSRPLLHYRWFSRHSCFYPKFLDVAVAGFTSETICNLSELFVCVHFFLFLQEDDDGDEDGESDEYRPSSSGEGSEEGESSDENYSDEPSESDEGNIFF